MLGLGKETMLYSQEREAVADACLELTRRGAVVGTAGNVSVRCGDHVAISPSGVAYEEMSAEDVGIHDLSGAAVEARLKPSSELPLHLAIYAATDHAAIVHTHAVASTALSTLVDTVPATHYYASLFGGPVRVAPYAAFGTEELANNVVSALSDRKAALLQNHGAVIVGAALPAVLGLVPYLEYLCDVQLRAGSYGCPRVLSPDELDEVTRRLADYGQVEPGRRSA
jgi:L-fuculose-phosphate aldolase